MNKILKSIIICLLLLLFPSIVFASETQGNENLNNEVSNSEIRKITGFEYEEPILENIYLPQEQRPSKDELIAMMPQQMNVYLDGESVATTIEVSWFDITEDYDTTEDYYYQFSPVWDTENYVLHEEIDLYTEVPYVAVFFAEEQNLMARAATKYPNEPIVYEFLKNNFDMNTAAICGVLANLQKESAFNPACYNGNDTGGTISYGLCQWNSGGGRYYTLIDWCEANGFDYRSLEGQLNFMKQELTSRRSYKLTELETTIENSADGAYNASMLFSKYYEGCASRYYAERANLAKNTYWPAYKHLASHPVFDDVIVSDWFYGSVDYVYNKKLMTGMGTNLFGPYDKLSRAQFVVILHRLTYSPASAYENIFRDVPNGTWYTTAVMWANKGFVVTGYGNGLFGPADMITREQIATILFRYTNGMRYDASKRANLSAYTDASSVSPFAQEAMEWAVGSGIITGTNGGTSLSPQSYATRAECATIMMRYCKVYNR